MNKNIFFLLFEIISAIPLTEIKEEVREILLSVKTTKKFHKTRLNLLLETWSPEALENVSWKSEIKGKKGK